VRNKSSFEIVKECYLNLPEEIRSKYRGKFTPIIDELEVYNELTNRGFSVAFKSGQGSFDLLVNEKKKLEVKACNRDNTWVKKDSVAGCSGIKPSKFDVLIYVEFDDSLSSFEHYIFTSKEAMTFPFTYQEKSFFARSYVNSESRTLNNPFSSEYMKITEEDANRLNIIVKNAKDSWNKI
jgi:hypothetical protein